MGGENLPEGSQRHRKSPPLLPGWLGKISHRGWCPQSSPEPSPGMGQQFPGTWASAVVPGVAAFQAPARENPPAAKSLWGSIFWCWNCSPRKCIFFPLPPARVVCGLPEVPEHNLANVFLATADPSWQATARPHHRRTFGARRPSPSTDSVANKPTPRNTPWRCGLAVKAPV